jgi:lipopolysaccharide export system protein LptA
MIDPRALLVGTLFLALASTLGAAGAEAATKPASPPPQTSNPVQILPGTSSKEPISIDADKLVYFDKEQKAIYSGNVVVIQGDTKMTCSVMTVYLDRAPAPDANGQAADAQGAAGSADARQAPSQNSGIKRLEAAGPVTVVSKAQVATGDNGTYDKLQDKVFLIGHVTLSDGQNVTKGDKLTYDLKTGQATIDANGGKSGRVHGQFTPNNGAEPAKSK